MKSEKFHLKKTEAKQRKRGKKDAQYIEAQSKFESMDIKALLCLALLEVRKNPNIYNQIKKRESHKSRWLFVEGPT